MCCWDILDHRLSALAQAHPPGPFSALQQLMSSSFLVANKSVHLVCHYQLYRSFCCLQHVCSYRSRCPHPYVPVSATTLAETQPGSGAQVASTLGPIYIYTAGIYIYIYRVFLCIANAELYAGSHSDPALEGGGGSAAAPFRVRSPPTGRREVDGSGGSVVAPVTSRPTARAPPARAPHTTTTAHLHAQQHQHRPHPHLCQCYFRRRCERRRRR